MSDFRAGRLAAMRAKIAAIETGGRADSGVLPFGDPRIDGCLPGGGLPLGRWHEIVGPGMEVETAAAPAAFTALLATPLAMRGETVWVLRRDDLNAPGLMGLGFPPERLIQVCARDEAEALSVMEDALATVGVSAVIGEVESIKSVSELFSPVTGTVVEANQAAVDDPSLVNSDPYGAGWLLKVDVTATGQLLTAQEYAAHTSA